jgi:hypothetical protein
MNKLIILLICVLPYSLSLAQFNDSIHHYVNYTTAGSLNRTNDGDAYLLNNSLRFNTKKKSVAFNATSAWIYGQQNKVATNNDFSTYLDFNLYKSLPHFFYWGLAGYDHSLSLKINKRLQAGLGAAYSVLDKPNTQLNLSNGIIFETSDLFLNDTLRDVYHTFRNSFRLRFHFVIKDIIVLDGTHFLQNSLSYKNDYIIKSATTLSIKLRKWLSLTTAINFNKLNRTNRENLFMNYGLTFEKYF